MPESPKVVEKKTEKKLAPQNAKWVDDRYKEMQGQKESYIS